MSLVPPFVLLLPQLIKMLVLPFHFGYHAIIIPIIVAPNIVGQPGKVFAVFTLCDQN
jgi:hypothetical protein